MMPGETGSHPMAGLAPADTYGCDKSKWWLLLLLLLAAAETKSVRFSRYIGGRKDASQLVSHPPPS